MKNIFFTLLVCGVLFSCSKNDFKNNPTVVDQNKNIVGYVVPDFDSSFLGKNATLIQTEAGYYTFINLNQAKNLFINFQVYATIEEPSAMELVPYSNQIIDNLPKGKWYLELTDVVIPETYSFVTKNLNFSKEDSLEGKYMPAYDWIMVNNENTFSQKVIYSFTDSLTKSSRLEVGLAQELTGPFMVQEDVSTEEIPVDETSDASSVADIDM